jgi:hypothetical protein
MGVGLQPLRVPVGWRIDWNTLFEDDPTEPANAAGYYCGTANLFLATHERRKQAIDIEWRVITDPLADGRYVMRVLRMVQAQPDANSRRSRPIDGLEVEWTDPVHKFETVSRLELVTELEAWLAEDRSRYRPGKGHPAS